MAKLLVSDEMWATVTPLLQPEQPKPKGGRPSLPDRAPLMGILLVLRAGMPWKHLPTEIGCWSGHDLLAYLPDLNPIEQAFAKLKSLLGKAGARTQDALWTTIDQVLDRFSPDEYRNYLAHSGYAFE